MSMILQASQARGLAATVSSPTCTRIKLTRSTAATQPKSSSSHPQARCHIAHESPVIPVDSCRIAMAGESQYRRPSEASRSYIKAARCRAAPLGSVDTCKNITWQEGAVCRSSKERLLGQRGCVIWFTGLSGSGKSTVAITLEHALAAHGRLTTLLDGDNIRHGLNNNLGFSPADREENIRRIGEVSKLMMEAGVMTITSFISPYERDRSLVRSRMPAGDFIEVFMKVPIEVCEARDPKGLYKLARAGKLKCFTGIDDPYEAPQRAEIVLEHLGPDGEPVSPDDMAATVVDYLQQHGFLPPDFGGSHAAQSNGS